MPALKNVRIQPTSELPTTSGCAQGTALIGVDDLEPPRWASVDEQVAKAGLWQTVRELPSAAAVVVRLAWATAPRLTALAVVVQLASGAATAFGLFATANAFSALLESGPTPQRVLASLPAIAAVVVAFAVRGLFESLAGAVQGTLTPRVRHAAQAELNAAVASVQLITWEDADFRELARQGGYQGVTAVEASVRGVSEVLASMVALVAALITTGLLSIWLVPVLLLATTADALASMHAAKLGYRSFLAMVTRRMRLHVVEALLVARDVAAERTALNLQGTLLAEHQRVAEEVTSEAIRLERRKTVVRLLGRTLSGIGSGAAYVVLGTLLYLGIMPLAVAGTAVVAMRTAASALSRTMVAVNRLYEHSFYIGFFQKLLQEARAHHPVPAARTAPLDPEIRLEKVSFRYPGQETYALQDIDLMVRPGEVIALVGENGSGKTTLGKVLVGLYPPTSGRVWWDDVDLSTADPGSIHSRIAIIAQDPARWPMTAALNIRIGRLERAPSHDALWREAISRSGADEVLASLPHGEHTIVSRQFRGGQDLSGGQWQRLSVARGIYRNAAILVADEPTAALDAKAEALVFAGLQHASSTHDSTNGQRNTKTTVLITHRLANIAQADRIIVLEQGRIVETGTHAELIGLAGRYHEMYSLQAQQFSIPAQEAPHSSPLVDG